MTTAGDQPNLARMWRLGREKLSELESPFGFDASDQQTGLYAALFGRDSLWILSFLLEAAERDPTGECASWVERQGSKILEGLCDFQGQDVHDSIEEQPGKIIHEYREKLDSRLISYGMPFIGGRSYSGFDQTFLFVTMAKRFIDAFPDTSLRDVLWSSVKSALEWIERYADPDGDGLYEYHRRDPRNHVNQVWKDSVDSALDTGFDLPKQPLAWIEVQAYAYRALYDAAELYVAFDQSSSAEARRLEDKAASVRDRVNEAFWLKGERCYAGALDGAKTPIPMVASNAGHALWAGLVDAARAKELVDRLMRPDLMTPYGLRTLSTDNPHYAPFAYHRGNIWPFDNAVVASGLIRYGFRQEAESIMSGVVRAIERLGSPIELYVVLDTKGFVAPPVEVPEVLAFRKFPAQNQSLGETAAALMYFASALAELQGKDFPGA